MPWLDSPRSGSRESDLSASGLSGGEGNTGREVQKCSGGSQRYRVCSIAVGKGATSHKETQVAKAPGSKGTGIISTTPVSQ